MRWAPPREHRAGCIACAVDLKEGDAFYPDESGGVIHAACCGPERECYTRNGRPLRRNEPIPAPQIWGARP